MLNIERRLDHFETEAFVGARHREHFGFADAPSERLDQAFVVNQRDRIANAQLIEPPLHPGHAADAGEVGQVQLQLAEDPVHRVVSAHDEFNRVAEEGGRWRDRGNGDIL